MFGYQDLVVWFFFLLTLLRRNWILFLELFVRVIFLILFLSVYLRQLYVLVFRNHVAWMINAARFGRYLFWLFRTCLTINFHYLFFFPFSFTLRICCRRLTYDADFAVCDHFKYIFEVFSELVDSCHMIITLDLSPLSPHNLCIIKIYLLNSLLR